jgi:glyoxylase-like metal-dependent hydrolase (beta-lactamase superfamily II)
MQGRRLSIISLVAVVGLGLASVQALTQQPRGELTIEKVKDSLYNIVGNGGNVGVLVTDEGVILVDDKFEEDYDAIMARIRSVTSQPVKYVINTHYHADHSGGNTRFLPVAEVISTRNARTNILEGKQSNAPPGVRPANTVFTEEMSVFLGGQEVRARHFGRGHTNTDAIVYFPALRTIHTGDMMAGATPLIDYNGGGSIVEWTRTWDAAVAEFDFDTVIPGHGAVTDPAGLQTYRDNVVKLRDRVRGLIRDGKTEAEIGAALAEDYPAYAEGSLYRQWSLPGFMTELR